MYCPYCRTPLPEGSRFCPYCGKQFSEKKPDIRDRYRLPIILGGAAVVAALIAVILVLLLSRKPEPRYSRSTATTAPAASASALLKSEDLCKIWITYTVDNPTTETYYVHGLNLYDDGTFFAYLALPDSDASIEEDTGKWHFEADGPSTGTVTLDCDNSGSGLLSVEVENDSLRYEVLSGDLQFLAPRQEHRPMWAFDEWLTEHGYSFGGTGTGFQQMNNQQAKQLYKDWFYTYHSAQDQVWLVDVTRDGIDDMIVVSMEDPEGASINGYVYTVEPDSGSVKQIFYKHGSNFHAGTYFRWFLEYQSGYCWLGEEYGYTAMGGGRLDYREYYLDNDGGIHECYHDYISNEDYPDGRIPDEEYVAYESRVTERLHLFSLLYSAYGEEDEIAMGEPTLPSSPGYWFGE